MRRFFGTIERPGAIRLLWEPRGPWPDDLIRALCNELDLVHATDPFLCPSVTPEAIYWRLHGNGSHYAIYSDEELARLRAWLPHSGHARVMFNNIPRVADAKRFMKKSSAGGGPQAGVTQAGVRSSMFGAAKGQSEVRSAPKPERRSKT